MLAAGLRRPHVVSVQGNSIFRRFKEDKCLGADPIILQSQLTPRSWARLGCRHRDLSYCSSTYMRFLETNMLPYDRRTREPEQKPNFCANPVLGLTTCYPCTKAMKLRRLSHCLEFYRRITKTPKLATPKVLITKL